MNKLLQKLAKIFLGLSMAAGVGVAIGSNHASEAKAEAETTATWSSGTPAFGSSYASGTKTLNGIDWFVSCAGNNTSLGWNSSTQGANNDASSAPLSTISQTTKYGTYQTSGGWAVEKIVVSFSNADNVTGTWYIWYSTNSGSSWTQATTGTLAASTTSISYDHGSKIGDSVRFAFGFGTTKTTKTRINLSNIQVYAEKQQVQTYNVSFDVAEASSGYGTVSSSAINNVPSGSSITVSGNTVTINGSTVTATPTTNTAQYTYAFSSWTNASGTVTAARTITANFTRTTNTFTVGGTINNGSLSSTASASYGSALNITINPSSGYLLPETLTSVTMGGVAYAGYTYDNSTGAFSISSVTGNVVINATCPLDGVTHNISGTITNGTLTGDTGAQVEGEDFALQISPSTYYKYPTSVSVTGAGDENDGWEYSSSDGLIYIYGLASDVTITATCPAASITSISVNGQKTAFTLGESFSFGGTVKASYDDVAGSSNVTISTDLVDIDSSNYDPYTEANVGKATTHYTIEVVLKADDSISTSYNVTVTKKTITTITTYVKVTSSQDDWSGKYVFMNANNGYVMGTSITSNRVVNGTTSDIKNSSGNTIGASDTVIASGYTNYVYTITYVSTVSSVKYYTISPDTGGNAGKFMSANGTKNQAQFLANTDTSDYRLWSISYSSGFVFENKGNKAASVNYTLRCNDANGWAAYGSTQATNGTPCLFAKTETPAGVRSLIRLTATGPAANVKIEGDEVETSDFIATALFDTAETATVTPTIVSVNGGSPTSHLVEGSNTIVLSYTDPNNGSNTKTCEVTVIAAEQTAELDGITWDKEAVDITQFESSTIVYGTLHKHFDDDSTIILDLAECTVAVYTKSGLNFIKDHDIANPTSYTLDLDDDNGKYLGVSYSGYTKYSGKLNVVENINAVYGKVETTTFTTKASLSNPIKVGDTVVFAYDEASMEMTDVVSGTKGVVSEFTTNPVGTFALTVEEGSAEGSFAFKNGSSYIAYTSAATSGSNNLWLVDSIQASSSWTIAYDGTDVTITNVYNTGRSLRYNTSSNQERISGYVSASTTFPLIQVYIGETEWKPSGADIANTNVTVQKAVLDYAVLFNETMACIQNGSTVNVSGKWENLEGYFDDLLADFTGSDLVHCKALFQGADAVDGGDTLQDMLARYEYIVGKYKTLDDFLHTETDRPEVQRSATISPLTLIGLNGENANSIAIIVIISMVSMTAIGGYFFLRKRKEN